MNWNNGIQLLIYLIVLVVVVKPLGTFMAYIYEGRPAGVNVWFGSFEKWIYRICGVKDDVGMTWKEYAFALMLFNVLGLIVVYVIQRFQGFLPFNPMGMTAVSPDSSFNTAVSFATNTNWQGYGGESTMSYFTQMLALTVQNFVSAATGMAVLVALIRGFVQKQTKTLGNFWVDLVRTTIYILIPLALVLSLALVWQGVPQTLSSSATATLLQPVKDSAGKPVIEQAIALGPAASQIAIKQLGTNGGGFFNANSAHPYENPTPFTNFLEMLSILLLPAALCYTFGFMVGDRRQGWALLAVMFLILVPCLVWSVCIEQQGNPLFAPLGIDQQAGAFQAGGNMEGKEARLGIVNSSTWSIVTAAASNGSVNAMHDSLMPLGGMLPLWLIQLGEVIFGGVGSGLYGLIAFVIVAVFIAGLMIGRTPEYLGKKIEAFEMKMASLVALIPHVFILIPTALAVMIPAGKAGIANPGPHGFSEILYAFSSAAGNNGSAFAGLSANTPFYNIALALGMFFCRFWLIIPVLAMAGSLASKKIVPVTIGTLPTHTPLFVFFLTMVVLVVGALTFFPALALGPIVEQLMLNGVSI
ncbi:MAG: potassium-transporting ATPase subunit KdpA [Candidatus Omnitrophica bacterium]|nr:potassium-transporting ATPase subunit KdpA [Candidatus Omnitrophota bacterium]